MWSRSKLGNVEKKMYFGYNAGTNYYCQNHLICYFSWLFPLAFGQRTISTRRAFISHNRRVPFFLSFLFLCFWNLTGLTREPVPCLTGPRQVFLAFDRSALGDKIPSTEAPLPCEDFFLRHVHSNAHQPTICHLEVRLLLPFLSRRSFPPALKGTQPPNAWRRPLQIHQNFEWVVGWVVGGWALDERKNL